MAPKEDMTPERRQQIIKALASGNFESLRQTAENKRVLTTFGDWVKFTSMLDSMNEEEQKQAMDKVVFAPGPFRDFIEGLDNESGEHSEPET